MKGEIRCNLNMASRNNVLNIGFGEKNPPKIFFSVTHISPLRLPSGSLKRLNKVVSSGQHLNFGDVSFLDRHH